MRQTEVDENWRDDAPNLTMPDTRPDVEIRIGIHRRVSIGEQQISEKVARGLPGRTFANHVVVTEQGDQHADSDE
jgi:hypothetical protein